MTDAFTLKYIFPGGYIPALSEVLPAIERSGLIVADVEILRLHYAETLKHWRQRFLANRDRAREIYDERFCRMWEFYLASSEVAFRQLGHMVFQIQLAKRQTAVPLTRARLRVGAVLLAATGVWAVVAAATLRTGYVDGLSADGIADERGFYAALAGVTHPVTIEDHGGAGVAGYVERVNRLAADGEDLIVLQVTNGATTDTCGPRLE